MKRRGFLSRLLGGVAVAPVLLAAKPVPKSELVMKDSSLRPNSDAGMDLGQGADRWNSNFRLGQIRLRSSNPSPEIVCGDGEGLRGMSIGDEQ